MARYRVEWTPNDNDLWAPFPPTYEYRRLEDAISHMNILQPQWTMMRWRVRETISEEVWEWVKPRPGRLPKRVPKAS